ncbi:YggS family pyridoxal phosphate-dependent enzyme [Arthrobacter mangrovi]|uniref:Pyridoxal phosphate homeostasis protein n=1 Tax=Arthrobacter mangrovi TaxID=2966350 RepID=A0ABQ5MQE1_9MICC|nr:YggS family pyridoxal phosphate-dependent enzyme [Arthrobacter mangrovi]GLB66204.1 YggS family pyridoxal phosphate enzyme [Arthrobacter mangrovi]
MTDAERKDQLAANLARVRERIAAAAARRSGPAPELIVVTKFFPASDVAALADLEVRDVGENRDQEAAAKAAELEALPAAAGLRWHFIGQLQTNKAKSVVRYAHAVHSVDRLSLVKSLSKAMAAEQARRAEHGVRPRGDLLVLLQVDLENRPAQSGAGSSGRGGARPEDIEALAAAVSAAEGLELGGLMAVAPLGADPAEAFSRLMEYSAELRRTHPAAGMVSAGMSQDLEAAVAAGATHLRVGSDVLGPRPPLM